MEMDRLNEIEEKLNAAYVELKKASHDERGKWTLLIIALQNEKINILQELLQKNTLNINDKSFVNH